MLVSIFLSLIVFFIVLLGSHCALALAIFSAIIFYHVTKPLEPEYEEEEEEEDEKEEAKKKKGKSNSGQPGATQSSVEANVQAQSLSP